MNGYLADVHQWRERVEDLYNKVQSHPDEVMRLVNTVMEDSRACDGWNLQAERIVKAISSVRDVGAAAVGESR